LPTITNKTGHKVRKVNAVLQHPDPDKHFMLANLDYAVVGCDEVQILECKSVGNGEPNSGVMVCLYT
jgi:predicted phage-related endonuclease